MRDDGHDLTARLIDALHSEALILADEACGYFDAQGRAERDALSPADRVSFSCESLKVTTRLMHVVAWLLTRRAIASRDGAAGLPQRPLGDAVVSEATVIAALPVTARQLVGASRDLYDRVRRLEQGLAQAGSAIGGGEGPARTLIRRLDHAW